MSGFIGNLWSNSTGWVKDRFAERTSLDGVALVAIGVIALFFSPLVTFAAYGAIIYGAYTLLKSD